MSSDFIINGDVLEAYIGSPNITDLYIPDGIITINSNIFQEKMDNPLSIHLPASVEIINKEAFYNCNCKCFNIPKDSKLKYIGVDAIKGDLVDEIILPEGMEEFYRSSNLNIKFLKIPKSLKTVQVSAYIMAIPEENSLEKNCKFNNTLYIMYGGKLDIEMRYKFKDAHYVYDNIDIDSISIVNDANSGINYIRTSRGVIITDIDNKIANLTDLPKSINGEKVLSINILYPFPRTWVGSQSFRYGVMINDYDNEKKLKEKLQNLYPIVQYIATKTEKELDKLYDETYETGIIVPDKFVPFVDNYDYSGIPLYFFGAGGLIGFIFFFIYASEINPSIKNTSLFLPGPFIFGVVLGIVLLLFSFLIIIIKKKEKAKKLAIEYQLYVLIINNYIEDVKSRVPEGYDNKVISLVRDKVLERLKRLKIIERDIAHKIQMVYEMNKEILAQKERDEALKRIANELSKSNSSSSYDIYDENHRKIGEINRK